MYYNSVIIIRTNTVGTSGIVYSRATQEEGFLCYEVMR